MSLFIERVNHKNESIEVRIVRIQSGQCGCPTDSSSTSAPENQSLTIFAEHYLTLLALNNASAPVVICGHTRLS